jgi:hypothetical protein
MIKLLYFCCSNDWSLWSCYTRKNIYIYVVLVIKITEFVTVEREIIIIFFWLCSPARTMASSFARFLNHTQRRATVGRTPLDEWSARRWDFYMTTHTKDKLPCRRWDFFFLLLFNNTDKRITCNCWAFFQLATNAILYHTYIEEIEPMIAAGERP